MSQVRKAIVLGESPGDRETVALLARAVVPNIEFDATSVKAKNSFHGVLKAIRPTLCQIKYGQVNADAILIVVDADNRPVDPGKKDSRLTLVRKKVSEATGLLSTDPSLPAIQIAIGVAAPAIEAWLLHSLPGGETEANWEDKLGKADPAARKKELKNILYGSDTLSPSLQHQKMVSRMQELMESNQLESMLESFPHGLGEMVKELRLWAE